ncbi:hypothetical protein Tco_0133079 [Tanacetum coccineum]
MAATITWLTNDRLLDKMSRLQPELEQEGRAMEKHDDFIMAAALISYLAIMQSTSYKGVSDTEVDISKKTENQAKMTKLSMEWKRLCKIKAKVQKCQSQSQYRRISSQTGAGTEEYY